MSRGVQRRVSRRGLLAGAALGAGAMVAPPSLLAAPAPELWSYRVGGLVGASRPIVLPRRFALAGVEWEGPEGARVELRARLAGGPWSRWGNASVSGHGPDRRRQSRTHVGDPLWVGDADAVQLRSSAALREVRLLLVSPATAGSGSFSELSASAQSFPLARPSLPAGPGQPAIIARSAWAGRDSPPKVAPGYGDVRMAFVHHTDSLNGYSSAQVPSIIRGIYVYHRYSNGWNDIGYNFVIDAFGRIWEARAGGIDLPVVGAQAGGYNLESSGVAILGTFDSALPRAAALEALARLLAWKLCLHGVPVSGEVKVEVDPSDAFYTPFRPGQVIRLPRVAGHRQGCSTDCPGNALFAHLPVVRERVVKLARQSAAISFAALEPGRFAPSYLGLGGSLDPAASSQALVGRLRTRAGAPLAGATVELQQIASYGSERTLQSALTGPDGSFGFRVAPTANMLVRALHRAAPAVASPLLALEVSPRISLSLISASPPSVTGTIAPAQRQVIVELYRQGARRPLQRERVRVRNGAFTATLRQPGAGRYTILARTAADAAHAAGASAPLPVTVS
jgi:hypothetical protein